MVEPNFRVINVTKRVVLDATGTPRDGYHIDFTTVSGYHGFVDITSDRYSDDYAKGQLTAEAKRLEDLAKL